MYSEVLLGKALKLITDGAWDKILAANTVLPPRQDQRGRDLRHRGRDEALL